MACPHPGCTCNGKPDLGRCPCGRWPLYVGAYDRHGNTIRCRPERQFPRPWPRLFSPTELAVRAHWDEFTAPDFPVPERPGYDFTHYAKHNDPTWAPTADTTRARPMERPAHTTARQRKRGRGRR